MKKLLIASALSAAFVSPAVFAQATGFTGFYGQVGLGMNSMGSKGSLSSGGQNIISGDVSKQNFAGSLALGYNYGLGNGFNIGANVFYNISDDSGGSMTFLNPSVDGLQLNNKLKNVWGISVEPGYAFANNSLGYLKLGWAQAENSWGAVDSVGSSSINVGTANGFLYGIGYKHLLNKNVYVGVEVYQIAFGTVSKTVVDPTVTSQVKSQPTYTYGGLVIGAKF